MFPPLYTNNKSEFLNRIYLYNWSWQPISPSVRPLAFQKVQNRRICLNWIRWYWNQFNLVLCFAEKGKKNFDAKSNLLPGSGLLERRKIYFILESSKLPFTTFAGKFILFFVGEWARICISRFVDRRGWQNECMCAATRRLLESGPILFSNVLGLSITPILLDAIALNSFY